MGTLLFFLTRSRNGQIALLRGLAVCALSCAVLALSTAAFGQGRQAEGSAARSPDELVTDNSEVVAASPSQISAVLRGDPGLLLELKRWLATEAANRGQVVEASDLTDTAVIEKLGEDRKFRVAATRLLQRYGYLLPKIQPNSQAAAEREDEQRARTSAPTQTQERQIEPTQSQQPGRGAGTTINPPELPRDTGASQVFVSPGAMPSVSASPRLTTASAGADSGLLAASIAAAAGSVSPGASEPVLTTSDLAPVQPFPAPAAGPAPRESRPRPGSFQADAVAEALMPGMLRHQSPYSDIPSIYDMYSHAVPGSGPVTRFGEEIFQNSADVSGTIPMDFPASPDYIVGPGDGLTVNLWGGVSQRLYSTVDHEGRISLPEVGPVMVSGKSLSEVQQAVQHSLMTQFRDVSADVSLSRLRTIRVYVVGDVNGPGAYDVSSLSTPLNVLLAAGGPTSGGSYRIVKHYRGDALVQQVDLYDLLLRGIRSDLKPLEPGDTLLVPPVSTQIRIDGMVRRPALYELQDETTLAQAIDLAGGILPTAALSHIEVQRLEAHEKRTMLSLDVSGTTDAAEIERKLAAFAIRDRDEIHIFPIATFNQDAVYLQGHVLREGRYSYKPGMKLTDIVSSYADLLPEAAQYAEIIRLSSPDHHPSVESFDLTAALANPAAAPALQPLDTVRIFSRFAFEDAPAVSVSGAVRHPGNYQTLGQVHFRDAIQLSGGLTPDASMNSAQIIRQMPDSSVEVLSVRLKDALEGDPIHNLLLQPRDRILIQANVLSEDPRSVQIAGEVVNPGRYPLTTSLRVSDLIELAGGLKRSAERNSADLTQFLSSKNASIVATHMDVDLPAAMSRDPNSDRPLNDGDVLTIRQIPGWNDIGASVSIQGEAKHPGTYGIHAGERLSSVLERAGGFQPEAYPFGAILRRSTVQDLESQARDELIVRVKNAQNNLVLLPDSDPKEKMAKELAFQQWQSSLDQLASNPPVGRIAIRISSDIARWKNTAADIQLQAGDVLVIPKKPGYVMVAGQVFNPTAVALRPGKSANWYVTQSGGATPMANKGSIFVIRADGSVIGKRNGFWSGDSLGAALQAGDTVVVPERALSGNVPWQSILLTAQVASSVASSVFIALRY